MRAQTNLIETMGTIVHAAFRSESQNFDCIKTMEYSPHVSARI